MDKKMRKYHSTNSSALWVCIYPDSRPVSGVLIMSCIDIPMPFEGLDDLILRVNSVFDAIEFPQRAMARRSASAKPHPVPKWISEHLQEPLPSSAAEQRLARYGKKNMVKVLIWVRYRQNASWQGDFNDGNRREPLHFRSALELMELMKEVCCIDNV